MLCEGKLAAQDRAVNMPFVRLSRCAGARQASKWEDFPHLSCVQACFGARSALTAMRRYIPRQSISTSEARGQRCAVRVRTRAGLESYSKLTPLRRLLASCSALRWRSNKRYAALCCRALPRNRLRARNVDRRSGPRGSARASSDFDQALRAPRLAASTEVPVAHARLAEEQARGDCRPHREAARRSPREAQHPAPEPVRVGGTLGSHALAGSRAREGLHASAGSHSREGW